MTKILNPKYAAEATATKPAYPATAATELWFKGCTPGNDDGTPLGDQDLNLFLFQMRKAYDMFVTTRSLSTGDRESLLWDMFNNIIASIPAPSTLATGALPSARMVATSNVSSLSGTQTIDSIAGAVGDLVLLTAQTTTANNGPWVMASGAWTRPTWSAQIKPGVLCSITEGTVNADTLWLLTSDAAITLGTTAQTWAKLPISTYSLPARIADSIQTIANWNTFRGDGWARSADGATGAPASGEWIGYYVGKDAGTSFGRQVAWTTGAGDSTTKTKQRDLTGVDTWGAWYDVQLSKTEILGLVGIKQYEMTYTNSSSKSRRRVTTTPPAAATTWQTLFPSAGSTTEGTVSGEITFLGPGMATYAAGVNTAIGARWAVRWDTALSGYVAERFYDEVTSSTGGSGQWG